VQDEISYAWVWSEYKGELPQSADERRLAERTASTVFAGAGQRAIYVAVGLATGILVVAWLMWLFSPGPAARNKTDAANSHVETLPP
jgi:hypothetical protein